MSIKITVQADVNLPVDKCWETWTTPEHITNWNFASDEWHCPSATNDLQPGGKFSWRMESKDGEMGFDYSGSYKSIEHNKEIVKNLDDGREVKITFTESGGTTSVVETFEAEDENAAELQRQGWQAILNNYKTYSESLT